MMTISLFTHRLPRIILSLLLLGMIEACGGDNGSSGPPPVATYAISGTVSHLDTGTLTISDGTETLTVNQGATSFAFTKPLASGTAYSVTVTAQPGGGSCVVSNGSGTIGSAAITNVAIGCNTLVSQPLAIGVSPVGSLSSNGSRIFLPVSSVGTNPVTINAILDTGSSGAVLNATDVFPTSMVSTTGFVFPAGQTSITYNGITVTNTVATRTYGTQSPNPTDETGNIGFAQVTFGSGTRATTMVMPVLFVYKFTSNGTAVAPSNFANLIGVNAGLAAVTVNGTAASGQLQPCTLQSTTTCGLASPFRYFTFASGIDKGYALSKVSFAQCDITTAGACPVSPALTIGLNSSVMTGFSTTGLPNCGPIMLIGTTSEPICAQVIANVMVASGNASFTGPAIFDSGAPTTRLSVPAGMSFPMTLANGSTVTITTPSAFSYQFMTGTGYLTTTVVQSSSPSDYSNSGIGFFAQNSLLVNYAQSLEGWRNGS